MGVNIMNQTNRPIVSVLEARPLVPGDTLTFELYVPDHHGTGSGHWLKAVYGAAGAKDNYQGASEKVAPEKVIDWLLR